MIYTSFPDKNILNIIYYSCRQGQHELLNEGDVF